MLQLTLILASTLPVATSCPHELNAPARQDILCDVTYAVSYVAGSGASEDASISYSKSMILSYIQTYSPFVSSCPNLGQNGNMSNYAPLALFSHSSLPLLPVSCLICPFLYLSPRMIQKIPVFAYATFCPNKLLAILTLKFFYFFASLCIVGTMLRY